MEDDNGLITVIFGSNFKNPSQVTNPLLGGEQTALSPFSILYLRKSHSQAGLANLDFNLVVVSQKLCVD